jgi:hypothetical protein
MALLWRVQGSMMLNKRSLPAILALSISLFGIAGCEQQRNDLVKAMEKEGKLPAMTLVFGPGSMVSVDGRKAYLYGKDDCPERMRETLGDPKYRKCVVIEPGTQSVKVSYYVTTGNRSVGDEVEETWAVIHDGNKVMLRSQSGNFVSAAHRFGRNQPGPEFKVNEG